MNADKRNFVSRSRPGELSYPRPSAFICGPIKYR
jgi:hypothetical protein